MSANDGMLSDGRGRGRIRGRRRRRGVRGREVNVREIGSE
jgi:hypothetical protein